jgi:hypothetical protein
MRFFDSVHFVLLIGCLCDVQPLKPELIVGGYVVGSKTSTQFLDAWRPIFEKYLNEEVGAKQSPQIRFRLIAVDYREETSLQKMIDSGSIDLVCEHLPEKIITTSFSSY